MSSLNRREFLRTGLAGTALLATSLRSSAKSSTKLEPGRARNIIFLVSDGMSQGTLTLAEHYRRKFDSRGTHWLGLYSRPNVRRALMDTHSASSLVTDSAAASSAWGCGFKVNNATINITPDGRKRTPLMQFAQARGRATGLVSTAKITHATPAGFAAQVEARDNEAAIAVQYLERRIDVLLGGGSVYFSADKRTDRRDLLKDFSQAGYHVIRDRDALLNAPNNQRLLGVFAADHLPYALDTRTDAALSKSTPSLGEMAHVALQKLSAHPGGFVLQIEGARIDHAAHANDIGGLLHDQLAFDDAVGVAVRFVENCDDTLVIVTTDHGNSNPGLVGAGKDYRDTQACFERLACLRRTNNWVMTELNAQSPANSIRERVCEASGIVLADDEVELMQRALRHDPTPREGYRVRNAALVTLGQVMANHTSIGWSGTHHTSDLVELAAFGPGSEAVGGVMQNHDLFGVMVRALGLKAGQAHAT